MKNLFSISTFVFTCSILASVQVKARMSCRLVHSSNESLWQTTLSSARALGHGEVNVSKLRRQGFELKGDQLFDRDGKLLGRLMALDVRYLYEWAPTEYHEAWVKTGGIDDPYMKRILAGRAQSLGLGFYVSLHPADSSDYGPALTVFPVKSPLIILKEMVTSSKNDPQKLYRLGKAGIDTLQVDGGGKWLSIVGSRHLLNPKTFEETLFQDFKKHPPNAEEARELIWWLRKNGRQKLLDMITSLIRVEG